MRDKYPSEKELAEVLDKSHQRTFGVEFIETNLQLPSNFTTTAIIDPATNNLNRPPTRRAIQDVPMTVSRPQEELQNIPFIAPEDIYEEAISEPVLP